MIIECIVSGQAVSITTTSDLRVGQLRMKALEETGHPIEYSNEWEVRNADGALLVISNTLVHSDLSDGATVYIDPHPGVGA